MKRLNTNGRELSTFRFTLQFRLFARRGMQTVSGGLQGREGRLAPDNRIAFRCNLNADAMSF